MIRRILLALFALCAVFMLACSKTETTNNSNSNSSNGNKAVNSTSAPTNTTASAPSTAGSDKIGVPECDEFIAAYDACISKHVPATAQATYKASIEQWRDSWRKAAANPTTKAALASQCKQIAEQQKTALKSFGCEF